MLPTADQFAHGCRHATVGICPLHQWHLENVLIHPANTAYTQGPVYPSLGRFAVYQEET